MTLKDAIAALVQAAPPDATVTVRWLGELLAIDGGVSEPSGAAASVDLTVEQAAVLFARKASTVRTWCAGGALPGAYRLYGREWRIPPAAIATMQAAQASQHHTTVATIRSTRETPSLSEWRKHLPAAKKSA